MALAYGPAALRHQRFTTLVSTRGALVRIRVEATLARYAMAAGLMMSATTLRDFTVEHLIAADGVTIAHSSLPRGTTVIVATDGRGRVRDALIVPGWDGAAAAELPQPGTRAFIEAVNRFPLPVLKADAAAQDAEVFLPVTFPVGGGQGIEVVRGSGPRLRGAIDCGGPTCLLIKVDEETLFTGPAETVRGTAIGHMIVTVGPLRIVGALLNLRTEVRRDGRTEVIRSILVSEPTR